MDPSKPEQSNQPPQLPAEGQAQGNPEGDVLGRITEAREAISQAREAVERVHGAVLSTGEDVTSAVDRVGTAVEEGQIGIRSDLQDLVQGVSDLAAALSQFRATTERATPNVDQRIIEFRESSQAEAKDMKESELDKAAKKVHPEYDDLGEEDRSQIKTRLNERLKGLPPIERATLLNKWAIENRKKEEEEERRTSTNDEGAGPLDKGLDLWNREIPGKKGWLKSRVGGAALILYGVAAAPEIIGQKLVVSGVREGGISGAAIKAAGRAVKGVTAIDRAIYENSLTIASLDNRIGILDRRGRTGQRNKLGRRRQSYPFN